MHKTQPKCREIFNFPTIKLKYTRPKVLQKGERNYFNNFDFTKMKISFWNPKFMNCTSPKETRCNATRKREESRQEMKMQCCLDSTICSGLDLVASSVERGGPGILRDWTEPKNCYQSIIIIQGAQMCNKLPKVHYGLPFYLPLVWRVL